MAEVIKVTAEELKTASKNLHNLAGEYQSMYTDFFQKMDDMKSSWDSEDNVAFISQIKGFEDNFKKMYQEIQEYSDYLQRTADAYINAQKDIIENAKRLKN